MFEGLGYFLRGILGIGMPCFFHMLTGLYCPGCGGTRAVKMLLEGNLKMSFQYHPLVLYTVCVICLEGISWAFSRIWKRSSLYVGHVNVFVLIAAAIVVVNWIFKNYMLIVKGVDLLPSLA